MSIISTIRKKTKGTTNLLLGLLVIPILVWSGIKLWQKDKSFLKFSKESYYVPLDIDSSGFNGIVNNILEKALLDTNRIEYKIDSLNFFYRRLKFHYTIDSSSYLASIYDIRLDSIYTNGENENIFYYNSYLKEILEKQRKYPNRTYFKIEFTKGTNPRIKSIKIDPSIYKLKLANSEWQGEIRFADPFYQIDTNTVYLVSQKDFLPIFSSSLPSLCIECADYRFKFKRNNFLHYQSETKFNLSNDLLPLYDELSNNEHPIKILVGEGIKNNGEDTYIRLANLRTRQQYQITFSGIDSGFVLFNDGKILNIRNHKIDTISKRQLPVKIKYKAGGEFRDFYLTNVSPLAIASKPKSAFVSDDRLHLSDNYTDLFCKQLIFSLENSFSQEDKYKSCDLSLNPLLSSYLEVEIKEYISILKRSIDSILSYNGHRDNGRFEMSMCLVDNKTGEIIGAPFYSTEFQQSLTNELNETKNFNLTNHYIGSTFKPLITNAASIKFPILRNYVLNVESSRNTFIDTTHQGKCELLGYPVKPIPVGFGSKTRKVNYGTAWGTTPIDRRTFLNISHDLYPVTLSMLALTEFQDPAFTTLNDNRNENPNLANLFNLNRDNNSARFTIQGQTTLIENMAYSSFSHLMSRLYDVALTNTYDKNQRTFKLAFDTTFLNKYFSSKSHKPDLLSPELVSLNVDVIGSDNFGKIDSLKSFSNFSSWILGQGNNYWNNIKLAEAYSRLFTKRDITLSYWQDDSNTRTSKFNQIKNIPLFTCCPNIQRDANTIEQAWRLFLSDFDSAQSMRTNPDLLPPARTALNEAKNRLRTMYHINANDLMIVGKTGSPDEDANTTKEYYKLTNLGEKIYIDEGLYAFGLMNKSSYNSNNTSGITCVVYIKHISSSPVLGKPEINGVNSSHARRFLTPERLMKIIFFNKSRFNL